MTQSLHTDLSSKKPLSFRLDPQNKFQINFNFIILSNILIILQKSSLFYVQESEEANNHMDLG